MTTTNATNEMLDSKDVDAHPTDTEIGHSQSEQSEIVKPEQVGSEPMDMEVADSQPVGEQFDSQNTHPVGEQYPQNTHPVSEQYNSQNTQPEGEQFDSQNTQPESEQYNSQNAQPEGEQFDSKNTQPEGEQFDSKNTQPEGEQFDSRKTQSEGEQFDSQNTQPEGVQFDSDVLVDTQATSADLAHPEPLGEEVVYSPTSNAEHMDSQLIGATHIHGEPLSSEYMDPQAVNLDFVHSHPVTAEMDHSRLVSAEMVHPHMASAEMVHFQHGSSELVYSHPVSSEIVHSQAMDSEQGHFQHVTVEQANELVNSHSNGHELVKSHAVGMELVSTQPLGTDLPIAQATPDSQPSKRRKKKSIVWEHFTIETVSAGCRRACCKVCKQSFAYSTGSKVAGTSHLKRHIAKGTCPVILRQQEKNQLSPYMPKSGGTDTAVHQPKRRYRSSASPYLIFDQDRCRHEIARMIIMHDYPLHMVEHPGFVSFVQNLQPRFDMVSFNIVQGDCVATFLREKQNLQKFIQEIPGLVCLTLDMWSSTQSTGYVFVSGQFIDNDWKLHKRLLNVLMEPFPESDAALSHAIGTCLSDWGLDRKLASITFNQPLSETGLEKLRALLAVKNPLLLNGQLLIRSCISRTLSSMAQEVLDGGRETIKKIRTSVKYVKTSESHEEKFLELKQQLQVPSEKSLSLDNVTKWNTTYEMLLAASELKQVFSCLDTCDADYKHSPSTDDWKEVENICMYLKLLYDTANLLTTKTAPSSHVFFHEVWKIQLELARAAASDDLFVSGLAKILQDKFHKYWKNTCLILAVAVALDPRFKMKLVEFSFTKIFADESPVFIRVVDDGMHELFHEYETLTSQLNTTDAEGRIGGNVKLEDNQGDNGLSDFDAYIMETTSHQMKSELDQYLEESLLPRIPDFDVLGWWKLNKIKYPVLSKMARDVLSIPLSTVAPEQVFDTVPKEMDSYKCSLRPETVEALICAKDWLEQGTPKSSQELVVKMEL